MCPLLDFANHTPLQSESITQDEFALCNGMTFSSSTYLRPGDEVYLRYGGHSNTVLFAEYGFVLPADAENMRTSDGEISIDSDVEELLRSCQEYETKAQLLKDRNYWGDWTLYAEGGIGHPSFRLFPALRLFHISIEPSPGGDLELWENTLLGMIEIVSPENESKVRDSVTMLCRRIMRRDLLNIPLVQSRISIAESSGDEGNLQVLRMAKMLWEEEYMIAELVEKSIVDVHSVLERKATDDAKKTGGTIGAKFSLGSVKVANTLEEFLADPELQLVIITTPNETHYPFTKAALEAKKHGKFLLEKPVTPTYAEAKELDALAKSQGVTLSAFQNRRWDSDFLTVKKLIGEGKLGDVIEFESRFDRYRPSPRTTAFWREAAGPGAGHTFDLGPHLIDQALQLFGRPNRLTGFIQNLRGFGGSTVDDTFLIHLHYDRQPFPIRATVAASSLSVKKSQLRFNVRGTKGSFEKRGLDPQEDQLKARKPAPLDPQFGRETEAIFGTLDTVTEGGGIQTKTVISEKGAYNLLFENLANAISSGVELQVKFEQSAAVIQMIELAMLSSREGRTVEVPPA
ncbi:hypothetical protein FRC06_006873 [Ceratobasidium sp. 370]|nr:hypothetical protein FRC06_006873 [Ceratobasidium sp. 370]